MVAVTRTDTSRGVAGDLQEGGRGVKEREILDAETVRFRGDAHCATKSRPGDPKNALIGAPELHWHQTFHSPVHGEGYFPVLSAW